MANISVFIVDDHYMVVEGIRSLLQQATGIEYCGHAGNADSCMAFLRTRQPDVILLDINLPGKDGITLCREIHDAYPGIAILGLSTFHEQSFIEQMMANGASGYLLKNVALPELSHAIESVVKGRTYLSFDAAAAMRQGEHRELPMLTRREREVLVLIAEGLTNAEIADRLFVGVATVDTHRKNLLQKLQARNTAALVKIGMERKLI